MLKKAKICAGIITVFLILIGITQTASAQQVILICYQVPGQNLVCQPVDSTHPLPVVPQ